MSNSAFYEIRQRSHYDTKKSEASFVVVLPHIREIMQDGRFLIIRYQGNTKTRFEFDGVYEDAEKKAKEILSDIQTKLTGYYNHAS